MSTTCYYVVKPYTCGEHAFSVSYDEFLQDSAAYQAALRGGGRGADPMLSGRRRQ